MLRATLLGLVLSLAFLAGGRLVAAHCEVPCGIYDDPHRFATMLEDTATIQKAMEEVSALAGKNDGQSANQLVRWVNTKETHATSTQHIIAQYFMTQRLKPEDAGYVEKLTKAHAVMRAAMKCKQTVDVSAAAALKASILAFQAAYMPKKK